MRPLAADDRLAIQEVLSRYCHALDHGRWDELVDLFTADCRLDLSQVLGVYEGHEGLRQFGAMLSTAHLFMRHFVTNIVISGTGDHVATRAYVIAITGPRGTKPQQATGIYEDELVNEDGQWRFRSRRLLLDVPSEK
jgi:3-phenylpropionate/cinnamic acid dioxygenase small subunit